MLSETTHCVGVEAPLPRCRKGTRSLCSKLSSPATEAPSNGMTGATKIHLYTIAIIVSNLLQEENNEVKKIKTESMIHFTWKYLPCVNTLDMLNDNHLEMHYRIPLIKCKIQS